MARIVSQPPAFVGQDFPQASQQLYSYLFQIAEQLNVVLNDLSEEQFSASVRREIGKAGTTTDREIKDTYSQLRSLIITTANTIEAEMDELSTSLSGKYVAQSDFGTYAKDINTSITANAENITQHTTILEQLESGVEGVQSYVVNTEGYIRTGVLDNTVSPPIMGVEIGEILDDGTAPNKVRILPDRIAFYQGNEEACYIANGRWGAPAIDVENELTLGGIWTVSVDAQEYFRITYNGGNT